MDAEYIHAPADLDGSEGLLAIIIPPLIGVNEATKFFTDPSSPLQVAQLRSPYLEMVNPHTHLPQRRITERTQEVLFVRRGEIEVCIYSSSGVEVARRRLGAGWIIVLVGGGHSLLNCAYSGSDVVEIKTGPYTGRDNDKKELR